MCIKWRKDVSAKRTGKIMAILLALILARFLLIIIIDIQNLVNLNMWQTVIENMAGIFLGLISK